MNIQRTLAIFVLLFALNHNCGFAEVKNEYYPGGQLKAEWSYKDNKLEGISKMYYEGGRLKR